MTYVLTAIMGELVLHEKVDALRWLGIVMITLGVMMVGRTPARTTPVMKEVSE